MLALCLQPVCFAFIMPYNFLFKARHDISGKRTEVYTFYYDVLCSTGDELDCVFCFIVAGVTG